MLFTSSAHYAIMRRTGLFITLLCKQSQLQWPSPVYWNKFIISLISGLPIKFSVKGHGIRLFPRYFVMSQFHTRIYAFQISIYQNSNHLISVTPRIIWLLGSFGSFSPITVHFFNTHVIHNCAFNFTTSGPCIRSPFKISRSLPTSLPNRLHESENPDRPCWKSLPGSWYEFSRLLVQISFK